MRVSVYSSSTLQAVIVGLKQADREIRGIVRREFRRIAAPIWQEAIAARVSTRLESRVLAQTARVTVSDQNVMLKSAQVGRALSGGLLPSRNAASVEFGAEPRVRSYQARSRRGRTFTVRRNTTAQLRRRNPKGYAVFPAASDVIPRLLALWAQTAARTLYEKFEVRGG